MNIHTHVTTAAALFILLALLMTSCGRDRYELTQDKQGRTIRLDKKTGEVAIIVGDRLIVAKSPVAIAAEDAAARERVKALGSPKIWPVKEFNQIGIEEATLTTIWREGYLKYRLELQPVPKNYDENTSFPAPLTLKFYDSSRFEVISVDLHRSDLTGIVDDKGNRIALSANSATLCAQNNYEILAAWSLLWRL